MKTNKYFLVAVAWFTFFEIAFAIPPLPIDILGLVVLCFYKAFTLPVIFPKLGIYPFNLPQDIDTPRRTGTQ